MILRRNILPRTINDALVTLFVLLIIPLIYYFELFIVMPQYYTMWGPQYLFHFISGSFIMFNVCSNLVAIMICDTSIRGRVLPTTLGPNARFCAVCECISPPRSWHCNTCNICILKRDHHCMFTSCCIGHHNQRYFLVFVFYLFIATVYASYYNFYFIKDLVGFPTWGSILKVIFPLAMLVVDFSIDQLYRFLVLIVLLGGFFTGVLLYYHCNLIRRGLVTHERSQKLGEYDFGLRQNFIDVLGTRWYLVWVMPFLDSPLPNDGVHWDKKHSVKAK